ncbi:MAG: hypothetical protein AB7E96_10275 [Deferribacterales bacterium]
MSKYLIYYEHEDTADAWMATLMCYADQKRLGIVSGTFPIIGNLSVIENILLPAAYHHKTSYDEGERAIIKDLRKFNIEHHLHSRSNQLNNFERFIVKFLQVKYLEPDWTVFFNPRRMFIAEYEEQFHQFLRCEDLKKSVIIEHEKHRYLFEDMNDYIEKDFDLWATQDLSI